MISGSTSTPTPGSCAHCGMIHKGLCPKIKAIEYYENGQIRRVEYHDEPKQMVEFTWPIIPPWSRGKKPNEIDR